MRPDISPAPLSGLLLAAAGRKLWKSPWGQTLEVATGHAWLPLAAASCFLPPASSCFLLPPPASSYFLPLDFAFFCCFFFGGRACCLPLKEKVEFRKKKTLKRNVLGGSWPSCQWVGFIKNNGWATLASRTYFHIDLPHYTQICPHPSP